MHGLVNRSIQNFVSDCYGRQAWVEVTARADLPFVDFEAMLVYDKVYTPQVLDAMEEVLGRSREDMLEDFGTYLVSHSRLESARRLLRFGGEDFEDFLDSLDDLPDRIRLAVADLSLPDLDLQSGENGHHILVCKAPIVGFGHVVLGVLRAMADDYGALAVLTHLGHADGEERIAIQLVEPDFAEGREFQLGAGAP